MTPLQELQAQRDFLLANKWVKGPPVGRGTACLVLRHLGETRWGLPEDAEGFLEWAISEREPNFCGTAWRWNDCETTTLSDVLAVLDRAIILAKEAEAGA